MSTDDDRALGTFPKLTVNNYRQWEARIRNFLTAKELWGTIEPGDGEKTVDKDIVKNTKAKEAIWRTIDDANLALCGTLNSAYEVWKELKSHHGVHQGQSVYRTLNSLFSLKMSHDGSLREHIKFFYGSPKRPRNRRDGRRRLQTLRRRSGVYSSRIPTVFRIMEDLGIDFLYREHQAEGGGRLGPVGSGNSG